MRSRIVVEIGDKDDARTDIDVATTVAEADTTQILLV